MLFFWRILGFIGKSIATTSSHVEHIDPNNARKAKQSKDSVFLHRPRAHAAPTQCSDLSEDNDGRQRQRRPPRQLYANRNDAGAGSLRQRVA